MDQNIYTIQLHESLEIGQGIIVLRVPGGWIYQIPNDQYDGFANVFVPFATMPETENDLF